MRREKKPGFVNDGCRFRHFSGYLKNKIYDISRLYCHLEEHPETQFPKHEGYRPPVYNSLNSKDCFFLLRLKNHEISL